MLVNFYISFSKKYILLDKNLNIYFYNKNIILNICLLWSILQKFIELH